MHDDPAIPVKQAADPLIETNAACLSKVSICDYDSNSGMIVVTISHTLGDISGQHFSGYVLGRLFLFFSRSIIFNKYYHLWLCLLTVHCLRKS
jgi:hypothetical protein